MHSSSSSSVLFIDSYSEIKASGGDGAYIRPTVEGMAPEGVLEAPAAAIRDSRSACSLIIDIQSDNCCRENN